MRATIKMIAERAGVSIGTVDRVLHDRPYVKEEVRRRVLEVLEELDYHPNRVASALATSGMARRFVIIQPEWESYVGAAMSAGVEKFRRDRQDYNVAVDVRPYRQGEMDACAALLDAAAEEAQGIALCAADCPLIRSKLESLAQRRVPVVTFNSDIAGGRRLCFVGEDSRRAGRVAGDIAAKFLRPGDRALLVYADPGYAGHRGRADGFLERLAELSLPRETCRWRRPTTTMTRPSRRCPPPWRRSRSCGISTWPTGPSPPVWRPWTGPGSRGGSGCWPTTTAPRPRPSSGRGCWISSSTRT